MDRGVFSFIEPTLHNVAFMGWNFAADQFHQSRFDNNFGNVVKQITYDSVGRVIERADPDVEFRGRGLRD